MANGLEELEAGFLEVGWDATHTLPSNLEYLKLKDSLAQPDIKRALEDFITSRIENRGPAVLKTTTQGRSHFIFLFSFPNGSTVLLRVPQPDSSTTSIRAEKITNQCLWMQCLSTTTSIPIPYIYCFSRDASDLLPVLNLPFILMDTIQEGQILGEYLSSLPESGSDEARIKIYEQFAQYYIELRRIAIDGIGSVGQGSSPVKWKSSKRLLTTDMYLMTASMPEYPGYPWPEEPFKSSSEYFQFIRSQQLLFLWDLSTLNIPRSLDLTTGKIKDRRDENGSIDQREISRCAQLRFRSRYGFIKLIDDLEEMEEYSNSHFVPFIPDFDPHKVFYNPSTGRITGVFNFKFTNFMPLPFLSDPPPWLINPPPHYYIRRHGLDAYNEKYEKALPKFLQAMKNVEERVANTHPEGEKPLSTLMLESWNSKRFWFHYALEHIEAVDYLYYEVLYKLHPDGKLFELPSGREAEMGEYLDATKRLIEVYEKEYEALLNSPDAGLRSLAEAAKAER